MKLKKSPRISGKVIGKILGILGIVLTCILVILAFLASYSAKWYVDTYGQLGFDSVLYTLLSDLNGVASDLVETYVQEAVKPALYWSIPICLFLFFPMRKRLVLVILPKTRIRLFPIKRIIAAVLCLVLSGWLLYQAAVDVELVDYLEYTLQESTIYQEEYQDPATANITFPEQKRNLIYIFLESMETTYFSKEQGGMVDTCLTPELYQLAQDNINFSSGSSVGGLSASYGATWTIGAMVTQTAGIPLKTPPNVGGNEYGADDIFLPGVTSITSVLHDNGYYQALMVGSDPNFGGRKQYYATHGVDKVYGYYTAKEDGIIPEDYFVWWGMEDERLFQYAKQELTKIAAQEQPFAFTMLTVDTHHISGYLCDDCPSIHDKQYENVISCSSKKVADFVSWIQQQDFYENTTIVIVGDHPSMDKEYISSIGADDFNRQIYNCFINSAVEPAAMKNRDAFTIDMFPTTLAAMGCTIEGNRLGLGTNLFSNVPTLAEKLGAETFESELIKHSNYYTSNFFFE